MVTVYSCVSGNYDLPQPVPPDLRLLPGPLEFVLYTDAMPNCVFWGGWTVRRPVWDHEDPRRTARWHKMHPHLLFPDAEYSIWHDGSHLLMVDPWKLVETYLLSLDAELATFQHPHHRTLDQELDACIALEKDDPTILRKQVAYYRQLGCPVVQMYETGCLVRQHTPRIALFDQCWWEQISSYSTRDQLSIHYALWKQPVRLAPLPGSGFDSPLFRCRPHGQQG